MGMCSVFALRNRLYLSVIRIVDKRITSNISGHAYEYVCICLCWCVRMPMSECVYMQTHWQRGNSV